MLKVFFYLSPIIALAIVLFIRTKMNDKQRPYVMGSLWIIILTFGYLLFTSIYDEMKFDDVKNARFQEVIKKLEDIRNAQLAYETVTDSFANDWDQLVKFIDTASFTINEKIDMRIPDVQENRRLGISTAEKDTVIIKF